MRAPRELSWAALLLSCAATSVVTTIAVALVLYQQQQQLLHLQKRSETPSSDEIQTPDAAASLEPTSVSSESVSVSTAPPQSDDVSNATVPSIPQADTAVVPAPPHVTPTRIVELRTLAPDEVPPELRVDAYFAEQHIRELDHHAIFDRCTSVFAVIDAIHPYLEKFFSDSVWVTASAQSQNVTILKTSGKRDRDGRYVGDSDDDDDDDDSDDGSSHARARAAASSARRWRMPDCIDPAKATEIVLYPGVDPRTFAPDKIINLDPNAPRYGSVSTPTRSSSSSQTPVSPSARRYSYGRSSSFDVNNSDQPTPPKKHIVVLPGALILGGVFDVSEGSIYIGRHVRIEPNVYIKGPCILGDHSTVRSGAYLRGDLIIGRRVVLRGELKNALIMDNAELCHPGYCGDSICGYKSHFGNQVTTANLNLFYNTAFREILVDADDGVRYNTGRKKIGVVLGDYSQLGCSTVTDPCTLLRPNTIVYALSRLRKGIYGPNVIIKNKPQEKGVLEIASLRLPPTESDTIVLSDPPTREPTSTTPTADEK